MADKGKTGKEEELEAQAIAELNEISGTVKWTHVPFFGIPAGNWKVGAIWDQAYYDTAEYVIQGVVDRRLLPKVHGVVGVFLFRHFVELELKYILFHARWLKDSETNATKGEIEAIANIHFLDQLWTLVRKEAPEKFGEDLWEKFDLDILDKVVAELNEVDPGSYGFRYNGKVFGVGEHSADPELSINYNAILRQMKHVYYVLHAMKVILIETHGINADWEAEMKSW